MYGVKGEDILQLMKVKNMLPSEPFNRVNLMISTESSWLYCFTNPLELGTCVSLSHRRLYVRVHMADDAKVKHLSQVQED